MVLLKLQKLEKLDLIDSIISRGIEHGLEEKIAFLLEEYAWTSMAPTVIKHLMKTNKSLAFSLVQKCNYKN